MISWPGSGRRWQTCCHPRPGSTTARVRRCRRTRACPTFRAQNKTFRAQDETFRAQDETFRVQDETFRAQNEAFRARDETFRVRGEAFRVRDEAFRAQNETFREKPAALPARDERLPTQAAPMPCRPEALALARPTRVGEYAKTHIKTATSQGRATPSPRVGVFVEGQERPEPQPLGRPALGSVKKASGDHLEGDWVLGTASCSRERVRDEALCRYFSRILLS